ncbi:MAG: acyl-CoA dehydrogenase family protein [Hyphomicrobium sp.]
MTATLAFSEEDGLNDAASVAIKAAPSGGTWRLEGTKSFVLDGHTADLIVVLARRPGTSGEDGLSFFTVMGDASGLKPRLLKDHGRDTQARAPLLRRRPRRDCSASKARPPHPSPRPCSRRSCALPTRWWGGADRLREDALAYVQMRMQFGRSIASFQTTKKQGSRHAGRCRAGQVGGLLRRCSAR